MNPRESIRRFKTSWRELSVPRKILFSGILLGCILGGWLTLHLIYVSFPEIFAPVGENPFPPRLTLYLNITDEAVYGNGTVIFTVVCVVISYKNYPIPEGDLYEIEKAFISLADDILDFNSSIGEAKPTTELTLISGDFDLSAHEATRVKFHTSFDLNGLVNVYIGVIANGPTGVRGWDKYTTIESH